MKQVSIGIGVLCFWGLAACHVFEVSAYDTPYNAQLFEAGRVVSELQTRALSEASGMVQSGADPEWFWVHNDSGDEARLYLLDAGEGKVRMRVDLQGIKAVDYEDMTRRVIAGKSFLLIGDIGDNRAKRERVTLYQIPEPRYNGASELSVPKRDIAQMHLRYQEGPQDAEALMSLPDGRVMLISKRHSLNHIYLFDFRPGEEVTLQAQGRLAISAITGGDIAKDGRLLLRTYDSIYYWAAETGNWIERLQRGPDFRLPSVDEPQGEAICWGANDAFFTLSEAGLFSRQKLLVYPPVPAAAKTADHSNELQLDQFL